MPSEPKSKLEAEPDTPRPPYNPVAAPPGTPSFFDVNQEDSSTRGWTAMYHHPCEFGADIFVAKMMNLILNPNLNSSWLFRADVLHDEQNGVVTHSEPGLDHVDPVLQDLRDTERKRVLVRRLIPRNDKRDQPLLQTCSFHQSSSGDASRKLTIILYLPHCPSAEDMPFYHPKVRGVAHVHDWDFSAGTGSLSLHFLPFPELPLGEDPKLDRIAYHLLQIIHKHGSSELRGYVKRVHHDVVVPQKTFQTRYTLLKNTHGRRLMRTWAEVTDPLKHVFEDLGIAAFLIELWASMYKDVPFPGFVDIGCGNGLLVHILNLEGYAGWGFDARERKSWANYKTACPASPGGMSLEQLLLLPDLAHQPQNIDGTPHPSTHNGIFPRGTFIISNHADELTPWTPILATLSESPFISIPCCSHNLAGGRWRAPPPRDPSKSKSAYASLVDWVTRIAEDCGWAVETEMMRIPSSRNTCLLGRTMVHAFLDVDLDEVVARHGGTGGYYETVQKLLKAGPQGH